ncbi:DUF3293 domain-containing protein [Solimonas variicoloris]|uniref:DUF3293 domain-containing protein n=1 Tax=Solimonas variicoloris TaxID=254408 RepID=UPI00037305C2|nr:DUF3293 domain-containing protein [Solimonas variicoloris]
MSRDAALAAAYANARYEIDLGTQRIVRRIGRRDAGADAALRTAGCRRHWFIVTPCNPDSRRLTDADNAARLARFAADLAAHRWDTRPSLGRADDGCWPEAGACVFDAEPPAVLALARAYGQAAFVQGRLGAAPTLVWTR